MKRVKEASHVGGMHDIVSWCKTGIQELNSLAQDHWWWKLITRQTRKLYYHRDYRAMQWQK